MADETPIVGSVGVNVVPSAQNFSRDAQRELNPEAQVLGRELGRVVGEQMQRQIQAAIRDALRGASGGASAGAQFGQEFATTARERIERALAGIDPNIRIDADTTEVDEDLMEIRRQLQALHGDIEVGMDAAQAQVRLDALLARLREVSAARHEAGIDVDTGAAQAELATLSSEIRALPDARVDVDVDAGAALAQLAAVTAASHAASGGMGMLGASVIALSPMFATVGAVGVGALSAIATAAAAAGGGVAVAVMALKPVFDAMQAQKALEAAPASKSNADAIISAQAQVASSSRALAATEQNVAEQIANAQQSVATARKQAASAHEEAVTRQRAAEQNLANARQQAADAHEQAVAREQAAERNLISAQQQARQAQMDLNAARQQAVQDLKQLQFQTESAALSQRGAALQVEQAQLNLSKVLSDPTATDLQRKQAQLSLDQARLSLREQTDRAKELAKTNQDAQKAGVDGTERVKRAQDNLAKAQDRVLTQQQDLVRAREAVVDAEVKGAQQVAAAQQRVVDARKAVTEADVTGAERIAAAQQRLVSAQRNGARQVLDAQDRVAASQRALAKAQEQSGTAGAAAQKKYAEALAKLSPAGKEFLAFLTQSKGGLNELSKTAQEGFLPGLMDGLKAMRPLLGPVNLLVGNLATSMGGLAREMGQALGSSKGQEFVRFLADNLGPWLELTVRGLAGFATGMGNLWMAFAPVSTMFLTWFAEGAAAFAKWTENVGKSKGFNDFIDYLRVNGPVIGGILLDLFKIFGKLLIGLAPLGAVMASVTKALTGFLASCPPPVLIGIATAFGILWAALGGPVTAVVLALVGLGAILVKLWNTNKGFRDFVLTAWGGIRNAVTVAWEKGIKPALSALWRFIQDNLIPAVRFLWTNVFEPAFRQIGGHVQNIWRKTIRPALSELWDFIKKDVGPAISWLWSSVIKPAFKNAGDFIAWTWKNVLSPTLKALDWFITKVLGPTIGWLWSNVVRPNFERIGTAIKWAWDKVIEPVLKAFKWAVEGFGKVFETAKDAIVKHWDKIKRAVGGPITAVVDYVVNPFIGGFNTIGKPFGLKLDKIDTTSWPRFAAGGKIGGPWAGPTADNVLGISDYGQPIARVNPREWIHPVDAVDHYGDERMKAIQTRKAVVLMPGEQLDGYAQGGKVNGGGGATSLPYVRVPGSIPYRPAMRDSLVAFGRELQRMGMTVWRNSAFGGKPGSGHAKGSLHYLDQAIDVYSTRNWPAMGDIAWNMAVARGFGGNWQTRLYGDHTNHVHIDTGGYRAFNNGPFRSIMGDSTPSSWMASGTASGGGFNLNPFDALKKWLNFDKIKDKGEWAQKFAVGSAKKLIQGAIGWANPLSGGGAGDSLKGGYEALMGYAQMAKKWAPTLSMALSLNKLPATKPYMDAWLTQMMWESSGNPNIIQQIKDVNSGGNEARGILQVTPRTFAAYKFPGYDNIFDPISNMLAGINYAKARYGAEGMLRFIGQGKKHGYDLGTMFAKSGLAGVAENGPELVIGNQSRVFRGGERVYNAGDTRRIFNNLAAGGPLGGGGDTYNLYAARGDVAGDVASTLLTATRRVNRRGRYGGNR